MEIAGFEDWWSGALRSCRGSGARWLGGLLGLLAAISASSGAMAAQQITNLGPALATLPDLYSSVAWVRVTPEGGLFLADPMEQAIYLNDIETGERWRIGRSGGGPGEYLAPTIALPMPGDSTLIFDARQGRYLIVAGNGSMGRTVTLQGAARFIATQNPRATDASGRVYVREFDGGNIMMQPGLDMLNPELKRVDVGTGEAETLGRLSLAPTEDRPVGEPVVEEGGLMMTQMLLILPTPWGAQDAWGVLSDGTVALIRASGSVIEWSDGTRTPLDLPREPVTRADRSAYFAAWLEGEGGHDDMGSAVRESDLSWPEVKAPFAASHAPSDGLDRLWLRLSDIEATESLYAIIDRTGILTRVRLPSDAHLVGFSDGRVWIGVTDELGQVRISAHALPMGSHNLIRN